jgi:hypothetical protein
MYPSGVRSAELRARRLAQRVLVDGVLVATAPTLTHGTTNVYVHWGCHCAACIESHRRRSAKQRARRFAQRVLVGGVFIAAVPNLTHGTKSTYNNWGCRCTECTAANRAAWAAWRGE